MEHLEKVVQALKWGVALLFGFIADACGGGDRLFTLICAIVCMDIVFGMLKGIKKNEFSSSLLYWGVVNKLSMFAFIALANYLDLVLPVKVLRNSFIVWLCITDGASIVENTTVLGFPWPEWLSGVMIQVRKGFSINLYKIVKQIIDNYGIETEDKESDQ